MLGDSWRKENKNVLFYKYCEYEVSEPNLAEAYLAAITARYWNLINSYYAQGKGAYEAEDCYEWLTDVIAYAVRAKPWQKGGTLDGDPNGPDKTINVCMKSRRQGFYQWSNAKKRAESFTSTLSMDKMMEDSGDSKLPYYDDVNDLHNYLDIKNLIISEFKDKNYMSSFIIDGIINAPVIDLTREKDGYLYTQFNKKKLSKHLRHIDDRYCNLFSEMYNIPLDEVTQARDCCTSLSSTRIYTLLKNTLHKLSKNPIFKKS